MYMRTEVRRKIVYLRQMFASPLDPPKAFQIRLPTCVLLCNHCFCHRILYCHTAINAVYMSQYYKNIVI